MNNYKLIGIVIFFLLLLASCSNRVPDASIQLNSYASIYPDYVNTTIPWNIAPMNFLIQEDADDYVTVFRNSNGLQATSNGPKVQVKLQTWKNLLKKSKGDTLFIDIYCKRNQQWFKYKTIHNLVAEEQIDDYISYRLIEPLYVTYENITINQRNLNTFDESVIYNNSSLSQGDNGQCINCHSYQDYNRTAKMQFHVRGNLAGTVIVDGDLVTKVNLKTDETISAGVYPSWHPKENLIVYSVNNTYQNFHTNDIQKVEVIDENSGLILYDIDENEVHNIISNPKELATFPSWSPDGKYLYYASAKHPEPNDVTGKIYLHYDKLRYNILRKEFDSEHKRFMNTDTIILAENFGKSATFPRVSPNGRYLLFTLADYGNFHIWHKSSDLCLLDMKNQLLRAMSELNSPDVESYHSWSSNGSWIIFSSRREDGSYTRPYIAHFNSSNGRAGKPFLLPQKDPEYYGQLYKSFNIPEFMVEPVTISKKSLVDAISKDPIQSGFSQIDTNNYILVDKSKQDHFYD